MLRINRYDVKSIMASEMQISYGGALAQSLIDRFGRPGMATEDKLSRDIYEIPPQIHGYDFQDMYNEDVVIDLAGKVIQAYHFDEKNNKFAGIALQDVITGKTDQIVTPEL